MVNSLAMASTSVRLTRTGIIFIAAGIAGLFLYMVVLPLSYRFFEQKVSMKVLLSVSIDLARKGGDRVRGIREDPSRIQERVKGETKEGAKEMLTAADLESHKIMHGGLSKAFPNMKIISEEHDDSDSHDGDAPEPERSLPEVASLDPDESIPLSEITVWIDPLDATQEFTENLTEYVTTMVCVAVRGKPVMGIVHQPFIRETTWAYVNHAKSENIKSVEKLPKGSEINRIIVSRSHAGDVQKFIASSKSVGKNVEIIPAGGAGYKVLQLLHGKADAYVHVTAIKKWDICAANALIAATNGEMTTLRDLTINYSSSDQVMNSDGLLVTQRLTKKEHSVFAQELYAQLLKKRTATKT